MIRQLQNRGDAENPTSRATPDQDCQPHELEEVLAAALDNGEPVDPAELYEPEDLPA